WHAAGIDRRLIAADEVARLPVGVRVARCHHIADGAALAAVHLPDLLHHRHLDVRAVGYVVAKGVSRSPSRARRHSILGPVGLKAAKLSHAGARSPSGGKP